jgi:trimeric autotransporter adhesin
MKKVLILLIFTIFLDTPSFGLEPIKVAIINTSGGAVNVQVKLNDYSSGSPSLKYTGPITSLIPNGSGIIVVDVTNNIGTDWSDITPSQVNSYYILDVYVNTDLYAQFRLDNLIIGQSQVSIIDNDGNLSPPTSSSSLGSDPNRWEDAYVGSNSLHIGPNGGMVGGTEMTLSYDLPTNSGKVKVDGIVALSVNPTGVTIPTTLTMTNLGGSGNRNIGVDNDGNIVVNTPMVITAGDGLTIDGSNDLDVGGSATIIANANDIEVNSSATANQVLLSSGTVGTAATFGAIPLGDANSVSGTLAVSNGGTGATTLTTGNFLQGNGTGAVTATKAIPTGTVVGTTDTQTLTNKTINTANNTIVIDASDVTSGTFADARISSSSVTQHEGDITIGNLIGAPTGAVVGTSDTQTLTNKTIDSDNNTITNIANANIKTGAGIDATKLADGSVTSTEFQYIGTVTSNVQDQIDGKQPNLPTQTGNSGKYLKTDGTSVSWDNVPVGFTAGDGLTIDGSNDLDVGGSATIIANANDIEVNSSATANQVLLSSGTVGTAATFGAIPLGDANSVSGTLAVSNGGTGATTLTTGNFLQGNGTGAVTATKAIPTGTVVGTTDTQTLTNKTINTANNTIVIDASDVTSGTFADARISSSSVTQHEGDITIGNLIGAPTGAVVGTSDTQTLTNKTIDSDNNTITNIANADIKASAGIDATKIANGSVSNTEFQYLDGLTSAVIGTNDVQTLTNKSLVDATTYIIDNIDNTKKVQLELSGISTSTTRVLTVPNVNTTLVGTDATQTLTNKTLTAPIISTISNSGTITLPAGTNTLVGRTTTDVLTNKTLTAPVISTISNSGTITLPTGTNTLVGRTTTDVLTNKTLTAPVISTISNSGTITLPTATTTLVGRNTTDVLTNKSIDADNNAITNIENADIKAGAAIDATKIANGSVSNTEFQYLDGLTSAVIGTNDVQTLTNKSFVDATTYIIDNIDNTKKVQLELSGISTSTTRVLSVPNADITLVGDNNSQTLTNKTINSDNNTITNITNANIKTGAAIDATKIADGSVTSIEFQYMGTVTSNVQDQIDGKQPNLPDTTGKSGQYLKTEDGNLKWETVSGGGGAFTSAGGKTTANTLTDDFIFGADSINYGTGTENKFFFDNNKGAFRAGTIQNTNWDDGSNIGTNSFAIGLNTRASGTYSSAFGSNSNASGSGSVAMGISTIASNQYSFATGGFSEASGFASVATGFYATASGDISSAFGEHTTAESYGEFVVGSYDTDYTPNDPINFDEDDRAFVVGNGTSSARSDALIVYKNGNMDVNGNLDINDGSITLSQKTGVDADNLSTNGQYSVIILNADGAGANAFPTVADGTIIVVVNTHTSTITVGGISFLTGEASMVVRANSSWYKIK